MSDNSDRERTRQDLTVLFDKIRKAADNAQNDYDELINNDAKAKLRPRDHSGIINSFMVHHLKEVLFHPPKVTFSDKYSQTIFNIDGKYRIKCKKMDKRRQISCVWTQLALDFMYNVPMQPTFPGMELPQNLNLNYVWSIFRTQIDDIYIMRPEGPNKYSWEIRVEPLQRAVEEEQPAPQIFDMPKKRRVRPRRNLSKGRKKKNEQEQR